MEGRMQLEWSSDGRPHTMRGLVSAHQSSLELISAHQRHAPSHKISLSSRSIKTNQNQSRPIKANQGPSRAIKGTFPQDLLVFIAQSPQPLTNLEAKQRRGREVVHVEDLCHRNELVSVPDEEGNQTSSSEVIRGHQRQSMSWSRYLMREAIRRPQRSSEVIRGHREHSVAISPRTGGRA